MSKRKPYFVFELNILDALTDEERLELFSYYCKHCGCKQPWHPDINKSGEIGCQCWNDE